MYVLTGVRPSSGAASTRTWRRSTFNTLENAERAVAEDGHLRQQMRLHEVHAGMGRRSASLFYDFTLLLWVNNQPRLSVRVFVDRLMRRFSNRQSVEGASQRVNSPSKTPRLFSHRPKLVVAPSEVWRMKNAFV